MIKLIIENTDHFMNAVHSLFSCIGVAEYYRKSIGIDVVASDIDNKDVKYINFCTQILLCYVVILSMMRAY